MFRPKDQSKKSDAQKANSQNPAHELRQKRKIYYVNLDDSDDPAVASSEASSAFPTPKAMRHRDATSTQSDDVEMSSPTSAEPLPERGSGAGHSLRPRSVLQPSVKAENAIVRTMPRKVNRKTTKGRGKKTTSAGDGRWNKAKSGAALSSRQAIRLAIATETAVKRAAFLKAKKEYFLPLLPKSNHITRLLHKEKEEGEHEAEETDSGVMSKSHTDSHANEDGISPYVAITEQPKGYVTMNLSLRFWY